jgi:hypothetical protein
MKPEIKKAWVKALRSGKYKQGHTVLCRDTVDGARHCCIGVLADIAVDGWWVANSGVCDDVWTLSVGNLKSRCSLPPRKRDDIGLSDNEQGKLMYMNDQFLLSFDEIADWIEANL